MVEEKPGGFFQAATGVQQEIVFAGDFDAHAEIVVGFQVVDNHVGEVMDVDDDFGDAEGAQAGESDFEQRAAIDFDERLGASVGEGAEARAEAGGEDHGFHEGAFMREPPSMTLKAKRDSSHPQADPFAGAKGEEKIGLLRSE